MQRTGTFLVEPTLLLDGQSLGLSEVVRGSRVASHEILRTTRGDFVEIQENLDLPKRVGRVELHLDCPQHGAFVILSEYLPSTATDRYEPTGHSCLAPLSTVLGSLIWTPVGNGVQFAWPPVGRQL